MFLYIVLGGYMRILGAPSVKSCCTLLISASYRVFVYVIYRTTRFFVCSCRTWICLSITRLYEEQRVGIAREFGPSLLWAGGFDTICTAACNRRVSSIVCRLCRLDPCSNTLHYHSWKESVMSGKSNPIGKRTINR